MIITIIITDTIEIGQILNDITLIQLKDLARENQLVLQSKIT